LKDTANHRTEDDVEDLQRFLWIETDSAVYGFGEWKEKLKIPLPNTTVNTSLDHFHHYWILDEPLHKDDIKNHNIMLREHIERTTGVKLDHVHDLSRVLRVPGLINHKNGYIARLIRFNLRPVSVEEFKTITAPYAEHSSAKANHISTVRPITRFDFADVSQRCTVIAGLYPSKSERDIAEVIYRLSHGYTEGEVKEYLRDKRRGEKKDLEYYVNLTVSKALEYLER
jgi:hypothetical protein